MAGKRASPNWEILPKASRLGAFGRVTAYDKQAELYCEGSGYALSGPADVNGDTDATHGVPRPGSSADCGLLRETLAWI